MYMYNRGISDRLCSTSYTISHRPTVCITNLHSVADIITVFFCKLVSEVERRFGGANRNIMCGIGALTPGSGQFLEYSSISKFAEPSTSTVRHLALELKQMK